MDRGEYTIEKARFMKGVVGEDPILYDGTPQVAFIGRSNVGKSTTLNALMGKRELVKTGKTPGKTREINFFEAYLVPKEKPEEGGYAYFVDLPGYGYAKLSKEMRQKLKDRIEWYLRHPASDLALVVLLIDARRGITELDEEVLKLLEEQKRDYLIGVNKIDTLKQSVRARLERELRARFPEQQFVLFSGKKGKHVDRLRTKIARFLFGE